MELDNQRASENVEDRRGMSIGGIGGGVGVGTVVLAVIAYFLGIDPSTVIDAAQQVDSVQQQSRQTQAPQSGRMGTPEDAMGRFVAKVLASTEDVSTQVFRQTNREYRDPKLVLFSGATRSGCGVGQAAMGPFYCPNDEKVYIDLSFYRDLRQRFNAPGDFAQAYVIAHEVGHHVQKQLGIMQKLEAMQGRVSKAEFNRASVRIELQADCFAGVWAHHVRDRKLLDPGDLQ